MAEPAPNKQDTADLDAQLGTLLGESTPTAPSAQFQETEIGRAVDDLLRKDAAKAEDAASIEALDAELAKLADTMESADFTDETPAPTVEAPKPAPQPAPAAVAPTPSPAPAAPAPAAPPTAPPAPRVSAPAPTPAAKPAPAPASAPPETPAEPETPAKRGRLLVAAIALLELFKPHALRAAMAVSSPLRGRPPIVRDVVGWTALITVFWAVCLWGYVLLFRKADPPTAAEHTTATAEHAEAPDPAAPAPEPESQGSAEHAGATQGNRTPPKRPDPPKRPKAGEAPPQQAAAKPNAQGGH